MSASNLHMLLYLAGLDKSSIERFLALFDSQWMVFWVQLYLLIYTNNFCFGYITVSCFFETFLAGWLGMAGGLVNLILMKTQSSVWTWTWTLDFDLGFVNRYSRSQSGFIFRGSQYWNALPLEIRKSKSKAIFKKKVIDWIRRNISVHPQTFMRMP